ncbi:PDGLE domain-containing protein [Mycobacterium kyogaense]|uniref:PDGLE domain-containing protein n=1 Tax=Mycobacterium kyogaense TaxID=2212479 RepID=UPI000DAC2784|nr:PDGLE domain-containing protein [Mycobacterium kyogaense]
MTGARRWRFWAAFAVATLIIAGGLSYLASSSPDGLDSATLQGCQRVETVDGEHLQGDCIAQHAGEHVFAHSPLADYSIGGRDGTGGVAGVAGVAVTVLIASGAFWLIARSRRASASAAPANQD